MKTLLRVVDLLVCLVFIAGVLWGQGNAPFYPGQVAVYAPPEDLAEHPVVKFLPNAGISIIAAQPGREWGLVQRFRERGFAAGLNLRAYAWELPNDPYYSSQWHLTHVQSEEAWDITDGGGVTVAVLDTGLASGGTDGIACIVDEYDVVNSDFEAEDGDGHGTHVSGTISQYTNNATGVAGLAYSACIMPVKVLDDSGYGSFADIAEGIYYAVGNGARVINMSLGTKAVFKVRNDPILDPALNYAHENGVIVVCASGNDGSRRNVSYPAIYPTTIAVGATDFNNEVTSYSNGGDGLDLVAPGGDTNNDLNGDGYPDGVLQETVIDGSWGYWFFQGTSMASPHVAAAAAMLLAYGSAGTPEDVLQALTASTRDLLEPGWDTRSGWGLLQVFDALNYPSGDPEDLPPTVSVDDPLEGQTLGGSYQVLVSAADDHSVSKVELRIDGGSWINITGDYDGSHYYFSWDTSLYGDGTHTLQAQATDDALQSTLSSTRTVSIDSINDPPAASFSYSCDGLTCNFDAADSYDSDGTIVSYDWRFGDGSGTSSGEASASHTYAVDGSYTVTVTVTDNDGATNTAYQEISVSTSPGGTIFLSAVWYKVKGRMKADLSWQGAASAAINVIRDGVLIATTENDGFYTDPIDKVGNGLFVYQVCEAGTGACSNEVLVVFD